MATYGYACRHHRNIADDGKVALDGYIFAEVIGPRHKLNFAQATSFSTPRFVITRVGVG